MMRKFIELTVGKKWVFFCPNMCLENATHQHKRNEQMAMTIWTGKYFASDLGQTKREVIHGLADALTFDQARVSSC